MARLVSRNATPPPPSPQASVMSRVSPDSHTAARPYESSTQQNLSPAPSSSNLPLTIPNPLPPTDLLSCRDEYIEEAMSSVSPGTVNVVGRDQINNVTNYINIRPGLRTGAERDAENPLSVCSL
jgi:hypothetical protein